MDKESEIELYSICLGNTPGSQNIMECQHMDSGNQLIASPVDLVGETMYATVIAYNGMHLFSMVFAYGLIDYAAPLISAVELLHMETGLYVGGPLMRQGNATHAGIRVNVVYSVAIKVVRVMWAIGTKPGVDDGTAFIHTPPRPPTLTMLQVLCQTNLMLTATLLLLLGFPHTTSHVLDGNDSPRGGRGDSGLALWSRGKPQPRA